MNLYIIELEGRTFVAASTSAEDAVDFIAKREGYAKGKAKVKTIAFESTWYFETKSVTVVSMEAK